jgi:hypothetical protein
LYHLLANAKIAGLSADLALSNYQFGWVLSIFFFGYVSLVILAIMSGWHCMGLTRDIPIFSSSYIICEIPSNIIMKK